MSDPKVIEPEDAYEEGVYGTLHDTIENEAYTVTGQGPETAAREREQLHELGNDARLRSQEGEQTSKRSSKRATSSSSSSSS